MNVGQAVMKSARKKLSVNFVLNDSSIKVMKEWEKWDENNNQSLNIFIGATPNDIELYIEPTISSNPKSIVLYCGTNDLT